MSEIPDFSLLMQKMENLRLETQNSNFYSVITQSYPSQQKRFSEKHRIYTYHSIFFTPSLEEAIDRMNTYIPEDRGNICCNLYVIRSADKNFSGKDIPLHCLVAQREI